MGPKPEKHANCLKCLAFLFAHFFVLRVFLNINVGYSGKRRGTSKTKYYIVIFLLLIRDKWEENDGKGFKSALTSQEYMMKKINIFSFRNTWEVAGLCVVWVYFFIITYMSFNGNETREFFFFHDFDLTFCDMILWSDENGWGFNE